MKPALADRLSRAVVGCYPRRWKQRYAAELLDVLDQHLSRDAKLYIAIFAAIIFGHPRG